MSDIEKFVSPFIPQQFPAFYKEEGPNFIAFVKAYYEWMESTNQALQRSRSLLEYADIDTTEQEFLKYFRNTYLHSLPESIIADKRLLVKHILDLYRAKGTPRAYELLFRLIFNEDIELYVPSNFLFKPSDGEWTVPRYIEVTDSDYLEKLIGKQIYNSSRNATAVVESVNQKVVNKRLFHVLTLSSIKGRFKFGEKILCASVPEITLDNAPNVLGSLTAIAIENGGLGFAAGDIVDVTGDGVDGKARIAAVRDENGKVSFQLENGGSGYSLDGTVITVATALNLIIENPVGTFSNGNVITSSNTAANGTLVSSNSSLLKLIDFSPSLSFYPGDTVTNGSGASATVSRVTGGGGTGASFAVGGLVNKEVMLINTDLISAQLATVLNNPWNFEKYAAANLTSTIVETLNIIEREVGTISFLSRINPGTGYSASPFVSVVEPIVSSQAIDDGFGGLKGLNADVSTSVANSSGIAMAVEVINSGFGFLPGEKVFLSSPNNAGVVVTGISVIDTDGVGDGYWKNNKGFVSDIMNIQDSYYYQDFSYEILVDRMLSVYEKIVKDLIHPSGIALFGRFRLKNQDLGVPSEPKYFDLETAASVPVPPTDLITLTDYNTLTLARNSAATYVRSSDNNLIEVGANIARFESQGLLLEGQRTNRAFNPRAEYATTPTFPTITPPVNWGSLPGAVPGQYIGYATIDGVTCILARWTGTPSSLGVQTYTPGGSTTGINETGVPVGTNVTNQVYVSLYAGSLTNLSTFTLRCDVEGGGTIFTPNSTLTKIVNTRVLTGTTSSTVLRWNYLNTTDPVDFTLAIGLPQREHASFASSTILPPIGTRALSTRLTDELSTPISALGIQSSGLCTMAGTFTLPQLGLASYFNLMEINNGSLNARVWAYITGRRNLLEYTEQFDNAAWTKTNYTVASVGSGRWKIIPAVGSGLTGSVNQIQAARPDQMQTLSFQAQSDGANFICVNAGVQPNRFVSVSINLTNGTAQQASTGGTISSVTITPAGSSWNIVIVFNLSSGTIGSTIHIRSSTTAVTAGSDPTFSGDGTSGVIVGYPQLEYGSTATAYQRVGNALDVTETGVAPGAASGTLVLARTTAGVTSIVPIGSNIAVNTEFRVAISHAGNGRVSGSFNGGVVQTLTGAPTSYTTMRVGSGFGGDQAMFGYQRGFSYLNYAVSDANLRLI